MVQGAQYRAVESLDHKHGNRYPKSALRTILCVSISLGQPIDLCRVGSEPGATAAMASSRDTAEVSRKNTFRVY